MNANNSSKRSSSRTRLLDYLERGYAPTEDPVKKSSKPESSLAIYALFLDGFLLSIKASVLRRENQKSGMEDCHPGSSKETRRGREGIIGSCRGAAGVLPHSLRPASSLRHCIASWLHIKDRGYDTRLNLNRTYTIRQRGGGLDMAARGKVVFMS